MKISYNWLKDYISLDYPIEETSEFLTNTGLEVEKIESFESIVGGLKGLVVGKVISVEKHPNADKLTVTKVDVGQSDLLSIVCGAPNVAEDQLVVVAPVGATIYPINGEPFTIQKAKIRGETSQGMICAEDEIGLGEEHDGIMVLSDKHEIGQPYAAYHDIHTDTIFEIGLTPNRGDAFSHLGTARDLFAAIKFHKQKDMPVQYPDLSAFKVDEISKSIEVVIENADACLRFAGLCLSNIEIKPSPEWMQNRLKAVGVRPISNVVDITNYVMLEYGKPLHAYDADKIGGSKVIARNAKSNEAFVTLDEVERKLHTEDLMICDADKPMCIGGVFGGIDSGVTESTSNIFLESALFDAKMLRRTSTRYGLRTDAAQHFEKGIDPEIVVPALKRAAMLLKEYAHATISSEIIDVYPNEIAIKEIAVSYKNIDRLVGIELDKNIILDILKSLDFEIKNGTDDQFEVLVPGYRTEVTREADVIEEILRIYGYNNVQIPTTIKSVVVDLEPNMDEILRNNVADHLSAIGFLEVFNNSITQSKYVDQSAPQFQNEMVQLANSSTIELDILRPHMIFGGLETIAYNINRQQKDLLFYEFGQTYSKIDGQYNERSVLSLYKTGLSNHASWNSKDRATDFYDLKGAVEALLSKVGVQKTNWTELENPILAYGLEVRKSKELIGHVGLINSELAKYFDINQDVYYAELSWQSVLSLRNDDFLTFKPVSKFPTINRDLALVIDDDVKYEQLKKVATVHGQPLIQNVKLFDYFKHEKLGPGKKSYGLSFSFQNNSRTLTDNEVDEIMNKLITKYEKEFNALIRK